MKFYFNNIWKHDFFIRMGMEANKVVMQIYTTN